MPDDRLPSRIAHFRIDSLIGSGGMGDVYKAFDTKLLRPVAIKTIRADILQASDSLPRFQREAQACARLHHPNIVTVFETGETDGLVYMAMEYLQGHSLAMLLQEGRVTFEARVRILIQILEALDHAHSHDVIHRDIKPTNVHVQSDGSIKLIDFGIARFEPGTVTALTVSGAVLGTLHYASPEQLKGEQVDGRTDVYSTGALAYEMISGRRPFHGENDTPAGVLMKVLTEEPARLDTIWTRRFPALAEIVSRAMAKVPADRFQSAADMRQAFASFLATSLDEIAALESAIARAQEGGAESEAQTEALRPVPARRRMSPMLSWAAGVAALVVIGVLTLLIPRNADTEVSTAAEQNARAAALPAEAPLAGTANSAPATATTPGGVIADNPPAPVIPSVARTASEPAGSSPTVVRGAQPGGGTVPDLSAKQLYSAAGGAVSAGPGLKFRVIEKLPSGEEVDADPSKIFHSGERVRFAFEANADGYLYVAQAGSSGRWTVLFPSPDANGGRNAIRRSEQYFVPNNGWFIFDETPGTEDVFIVLSREPLEALPGFREPVTRLESVEASVVVGLRQSIQSRDLVFEKDRAPGGSRTSQATYVVNRDELAKRVAAFVPLTHAR